MIPTMNNDLKKYFSEMGKKGGAQRKKNLSKAQLTRIGKLGAEKRWGKRI